MRGGETLGSPIALWIGNRDWRFGVAVVGTASTWLPWLRYDFGRRDEQAATSCNFFDRLARCSPEEINSQDSMAWQHAAIQAHERKGQGRKSTTNR